MTSIRGNTSKYHKEYIVLLTVELEKVFKFLVDNNNLPERHCLTSGMIVLLVLLSAHRI